MSEIRIYQHGRNTATNYAAQELKRIGYTFCNDEDTESATHILLNIPSVSDETMEMRDNITYIGGNLKLPKTINTIDLLNDPQYLATNAMITAHCAIKIAMNQLPYILNNCRVLIIGWGRIGKCLAQVLRQIGCIVTVAARKSKDRTILTALGYHTVDIVEINFNMYEVVYNTAPVLLFENCDADTLVIDLASTPGITGPNVVIARGLPGKEAPASSGRLIASTVHRILSNKEVSE